MISGALPQTLADQAIDALIARLPGGAYYPSEAISYSGGIFLAPTNSFPYAATHDAPGEGDNGGAWPAFTGWVAEAVARHAPRLAASLLSDLQTTCQLSPDGAPWEWINGNELHNPNYTASGVNPAEFQNVTGEGVEFALIDNLRVERILDTDANGLPDEWELSFFHRTGVDPLADADGDGVSNWGEYVAGTNPTDKLSSFRIVSAKAVPNGFCLAWTTAPAHSYVVQEGQLLPGGAVKFKDVSPLISAEQTSESSTNYVISTSSLNAAGLYRIRLSD